MRYPPERRLNHTCALNVAMQLRIWLRNLEDGVSLAYLVDNPPLTTDENPVTTSISQSGISIPNKYDSFILNIKISFKRKFVFD